jgi:glutamate-ammonia-ligase adenylyltransferase
MYFEAKVGSVAVDETAPQGSHEARAAALSKASSSLADFVAGDALALEVLAEPGLPDDVMLPLQAAWDSGGAAGLRLERRRRLAQIAALDLTGEISLPQAAAGLADLAAACLQVVLGDRSEGFSVIGMGKLGGRELNYSSDIDLMFVSELEQAQATALAESLTQTLGGFSPEGQAYRIDLNLRPEGRSGALVRSLDSFVEYYKRWAKPWEFQALLKARPVAGDIKLGAALIDAVTPLIFPDDISEERVIETRRMKERVEGHAAQSAKRAKVAEGFDVKLGPGGIRDIEFSLQLLQLVHGSADPSVRGGNTLQVLDALVDGGYVARDDGAALGEAYLWLRTVEHRLQIWQERQVHVLPGGDAELDRVARVMGFDADAEMSAGERFLTAHNKVLGGVRSRFEKLFYRPMIEALSEAGRWTGDGARLSREAISDRLRLLNFRDAGRAARTLEGLLTGTSRRAKLYRLLTPVFLRFLAATPAPDAGLLHFLRLGEGRLEGLGTLRDNPPGLALLARVLGSGRYLGEALVHLPDEVPYIAEAEVAYDKDRKQLVHEAFASLGWRGPEGRLEGLRRFKRREAFRVAVADVAGEADAESVGASLSGIAEACLEAALEGRELPFAVIGMGKLGGRELGYSSDIDVMFVFNGDVPTGERTAEDLMRAIGEVTPEGQAFRIDAGLRPEGKSGPLARSMDAYREYYARWSKPWEHQALLKARVVAGDAELGREFLDATWDFKYPERLGDASMKEIRHLKARMERERIPKGVDPRRHMKMGPGGMADIEFAAQVLQLRYARSIEYLQVHGTLEALAGARFAELLSEDDAHRAMDAYRFYMNLRNRLFMLNGKPVDALPVKPEELEALGIAMGFAEQPRQELDETFLKHMRRARKVCERIIYGARA